MAGRLHSRRQARGAPRLPSGGLLERLLDPIDVLSQAIYSVLVLLTFTLAVRITSGPIAQPESDRYMLEFIIAALGAILAWGLIDGLMYVLLELFQRSERHQFLAQIKNAEDEQAGLTVIAEELDYILDPITSEADRQALYRSIFNHLRQSRPPPLEISLRREDLLGALGSVIVAVISVIPSLLPLILLYEHFDLAIRLSNVVSALVLFLAGYRWGIYTSSNPWLSGLILVAVATLMVAIAIPLGG